LTTRVRLGAIDFLNSRPVYHALATGAVPRPAGVELVKGTPTELNRALAAGEIEASAVSSVAYARHAKDLVLIPGLSINSTGFVHSVNLVYRGTLESVRGGRVAVTDQSATSEVLLRILLKEHFRLEAKPFQTEVDPEEIGASYEGALLIGDQALRAATAYPSLGRTDLGEAWSAFTGTPMVFALWCARRDWAEANPDAFRAVRDALLASKAWGDANRFAVVEAARKELKFAYSRAFLQSYFRFLRYDLGPEETKGLETYFRLAHAIGAIPAVPPVEAAP
jgi:chorismate dehydratase